MVMFFLLNGIKVKGSHGISLGECVRTSVRERKNNPPQNIENQSEHKIGDSEIIGDNYSREKFSSKKAEDISGVVSQESLKYFKHDNHDTTTVKSTPRHQEHASKFTSGEFDESYLPKLEKSRKSSSLGVKQSYIKPHSSSRIGKACTPPFKPTVRENDEKSSFYNSDMCDDLGFLFGNKQIESDENEYSVYKRARPAERVVNLRNPGGETNSNTERGITNLQTQDYVSTKPVDINKNDHLESIISATEQRKILTVVK